MRNPENGDLKFSVEAWGFDMSEALCEVNNALRKYHDEGYTIHSIKLTTTETPLLTGDEVLEQLKNEGEPVLLQ